MCLFNLGPVHLNKYPTRFYPLSCPHLPQISFFTARVRNTRKGTVFTGVCLSTFWGGHPIQVMGGTPSQVQGVPYPVDQGGYPIPGPGGGYLVPGPGGLDRVPPVQDWMGYPPPIKDWMGYPPPICVLSCLHAGGLSCSY